MTASVEFNLIMTTDRRACCFILINKIANQDGFDKTDKIAKQEDLAITPGEKVVHFSIFFK